MTDIAPIPAGLAPMPERLRRVAETAKGFMPPDEGLALYATAGAYARLGPVLEIGTLPVHSSSILLAFKW